MIKNIYTLMVFAIIALLPGCGDDKPSDKIASAAAYKIILENESLVDGMVISNLKRDNGWKDESQSNKYKIQYSYSVALGKPYYEIVLEKAKATVDDMTSLKNTDTGVMKHMGLALLIKTWKEEQGAKFQPRIRKIYNDCEPCGKFLDGKGTAKDRTDSAMAFYLQVLNLDSRGFNEDSKVGDLGPVTTITVGFMKTENGWQPAD